MFSNIISQIDANVFESFTSLENYVINILEFLQKIHLHKIKIH